MAQKKPRENIIQQKVNIAAHVCPFSSKSLIAWTNKLCVIWFIAVPIFVRVISQSKAISTLPISCISIITQAIIEILALSLAENGIIFC